MGIYVQYGCGLSVGDGWLNFDASPTLRIQRIPLIGTAVLSLCGVRVRFPAAARYGDIRKGPLVRPGSADAVYASHVLEHLSLADFRTALRNTYDMLADGGVFRLIVPDLFERARRYVAATGKTPEAAERFLRDTLLGRGRRPASLIGMLREAIGNSEHLWMWDEASTAAELEDAGFTAIRRCNIGDSGIPAFGAVEAASRFHDPDLDIRECAMEARKPDRAGA